MQTSWSRTFLPAGRQITLQNKKKGKNELYFCVVCEKVNLSEDKET